MKGNSTAVCSHSVRLTVANGHFFPWERRIDFPKKDSSDRAALLSLIHPLTLVVFVQNFAQKQPPPLPKCRACLYHMTPWLSSHPSPRGLTFSWWECYGLCVRHKPTELAHSFYPALVFISVFITLSTVFRFINSPDNSPFSHSALLVLSLPCWSYLLNTSLLSLLQLCYN